MVVRESITETTVTIGKMVVRETITETTVILDTKGCQGDYN